MHAKLSTARQGWKKKGAAVVCQPAAAGSGRTRAPAPFRSIVQSRRPRGARQMLLGSARSNAQEARAPARRLGPQGHRFLPAVVTAARRGARKPDATRTVPSATLASSVADIHGERHVVPRTFARDHNCLSHHRGHGATVMHGQPSANGKLEECERTCE